MKEVRWSPHVKEPDEVNSRFSLFSTLVLVCVEVLKRQQEWQEWRRQERERQQQAWAERERALNEKRRRVQAGLGIEQGTRPSESPIGNLWGLLPDLSWL